MTEPDVVFRVWCTVTGGFQFETRPADDPPTVCPQNGGHAIDAARTVIYHETEADHTHSLLSGEIVDVAIDGGTLAEGQLLRYDGSAELWRNVPPLEALPPGPTGCDTIKFTGSSWKIVEQVFEELCIVPDGGAGPVDKWCFKFDTNGDLLLCCLCNGITRVVERYVCPPP